MPDIEDAVTAPDGRQIWQYMREGEAYRLESLRRFQSLDARLAEMERMHAASVAERQRSAEFWLRIHQMVIGSAILSAIGTVGAFAGPVLWRAIRELFSAPEG